MMYLLSGKPYQALPLVSFTGAGQKTPNLLAPLPGICFSIGEKNGHKFFVENR